MAHWQPYREPLRTTLLRTGSIAIVLGAAMTLFHRGGLARWPMATLLMLWPTFGGHWVEIGFLNWLRPRISAARIFQVFARLAIWFVGGIAILFCMRWTASVLTGPARTNWPTLWEAGLAFIVIELIAHLVLQLRRRPSFYNGRG